MKNINHYIASYFLVFLMNDFVLFSNAAVIEYNTTISVVKIDDLTIVGKTNHTGYGNLTFSSFKGIPYAKPPIGELRFRPPVPLPLSSLDTKLLHAFREGPVCAQIDGPLKVRGSEDCLKLNVYVPSLNDTSVLLPVLVYIYGGAFMGGDDKFKDFDPVYLLDDEVVVVTINYRLGVLGFLSTEDLASPGNYALKDQIQALSWVKTYIHYFNGDPDKVTINGQSAGGASVSYLSQTNLTNGLFRASIIQSASSITLWALTRTPKRTAHITASLLNVNTRNSSTIVDGLRKVNYVDLVRASFQVFAGNAIAGNPLDGLPYGPTVEPPHSGAVVTGLTYERLSRGLFNNISFLMGYNSLEAFSFIQPIIEYFPMFLWRYDLNPTSLVPASMNINSESTKLQVNEIIKEHYFGSVPVSLSGTNRLSVFVSDDEFVRPVIEAARLYSRKQPLYLYKFSYKLSANSKDPGVGHGFELPFLWANSPFPRSPTDFLTLRRTVRLWTNFVKTGNPTPVADPLFENVTWPLASSAGKDRLAFLGIDGKLTPGINPNREAVEFWNKLFARYGRPPYSTY